MRVVDYVIDQVYRAGAKHVFTITGGGAMFLNDAVAAHPFIMGIGDLYRGLVVIKLLYSLMIILLGRNW